MNGKRKTGYHKIANVLLPILALASFLLPAQHVDAAPKNRNEAGTHMSSEGRANISAQWKAHPEKGWVRAEDVQEHGNRKKENSRRGNGKLQRNGAKNKH